MKRFSYRLYSDWCRKFGIPERLWAYRCDGLPVDRDHMIVCGGMVYESYRLWEVRA